MSFDDLRELLKICDEIKEEVKRNSELNRVLEEKWSILVEGLKERFDLYQSQYEEDIADSKDRIAANVRLELINKLIPSNVDDPDPFGKLLHKKDSRTEKFQKDALARLNECIGLIPFPYSPNNRPVQRLEWVDSATTQTDPFLYDYHNYVLENTSGRPVAGTKYRVKRTGWAKFNNEGTLVVHRKARIELYDKFIAQEE